MSERTALRSQLRYIESILETYDDVTEVMANPDGAVWIETAGAMKHIDSITTDYRHSLIRLLAGAHDLICDSEHPTLNAKLPSLRGGRFQGVIPPVVTAPTFSIRFPPQNPMTLSDLRATGTISANQETGLRHRVRNHNNIIIAGSTGSGKTTIATAILQEITDERILVLEDNPELFTASPNVVHYLTQEGFTLRDGVQVSLRMNPDRIIVGEMRDGHTALDLTKAWMTGHKGGISTIHANSATQVQTRLHTLLQEAVITPSWDLIESATEVVVFVEKVSDGGITRRQVTEFRTPKNAKPQKSHSPGGR
jgi:type IV secretion system protein VirB11